MVRCRLLTATLLGLALGLAACSTPATRWPVPPVQPRERLVDITHYDIEIDLDHRAGHVDGRVTVHLTGLPGAPGDRLQLDAVELDVRSVSDAWGDELPFSLADHLLTIELGQSLEPGDAFEVTVEYGGFPRRGLYFVPPAPEEGARPWQVWTQGQSEETRHWVPVRDIPDERATHTLAVTVDADLVTMAAGELVSSHERRDGRRTDTWSMDTSHVSYLITLVVGGFAQIELPRDPSLPDVPLPVLMEAADAEHAAANLAETGEMLARMGDYLDAPYPYVKYAQCCVKEYTGGGMENISATTLYYRTLHDPADEPQVDSTGLVAHEAAHQWFGDWITCESWDHIWLNEGFADYLENLWFRWESGEALGDWRRLQSQRAYVSAELRGSRPVVWDGWEHPDDTFSDHVYPGGAARLHLLAAVLGEDDLQRGLRAYVAEHQDDVVVTDDLRRSLERATGADLAVFFDQWLYGPGFPRLEALVEDGWHVTEGAHAATPSEPSEPSVPETVLIVRQTQDDDGWPEVFRAPLRVSWSRGGVEHAQVLQLDERVERFALDGQGPLDWVCLDDDARLPKTLGLVQDEAHWRAQLRTASAPLARLAAAEWFAGSGWVRTDTPAGWRPDSASFEALRDAVDQDDFVPARLAALDALTARDDPRLVALLERTLTDPEPELRAAAAAAFADHGSEEQMIPPVFDALVDPNASVVAAALGTLVERSHPAAWREVQRTYAEASLPRWRLARDCVDLAARLDEPGVVPFLMRAARAHPEERVRADRPSP